MDVLGVGGRGTVNVPSCGPGPGNIGHLFLCLLLRVGGRGRRKGREVAMCPAHLVWQNHDPMLSDSFRLA